MVLLMGERDDDPLFLQWREAKESVLAPYTGPGEHSSQGERVVEGQRIMQAASDSFPPAVSLARCPGAASCLPRGRPNPSRAKSRRAGRPPSG